MKSRTTYQNGEMNSTNIQKTETGQSSESISRDIELLLQALDTSAKELECDSQQEDDSEIEEEMCRFWGRDSLDLTRSRMLNRARAQNKHEKILKNVDSSPVSVPLRGAGCQHKCVLAAKCA